MNTLTPAQEELLARVVGGDLEPDAPNVVEERKRSPDFAAELDLALRILHRVRTIATEIRQDILEAATPSNTHGDEAIRDAVVASLTRPTASRLPDTRARFFRRTAFAVAASLALAAAWWLTRDDSRSAPPIQYLGDSLACVSPIGPGADFRVFRFDGILPSGAWYDIVILAPDGAELIRSARLERNEFSLTAEQADRLPDEIEWHVTMRDIGGVRASASARARR